MSEYNITRYRGKLALVYYDADGKRHRHTLGTADPGEAKRLAPALHAELTRPRGRTVGEIWSAYVKEMEGRQIAINMVYSWKPLQERFGPMDATGITIDDCRAHTAERRSAGIKDGTIHTELGHLRSALLWAAKRRLISEAPYIERPAKPKPKEDYLTRNQIRALIDAAQLPHIKTYIILAIGTGGRNRALLDLTWNRVDFEKDMIDLRNPNLTQPHKGRAVVPMNQMVRAALEEAHAGALSEYVVEWAGRQVKSVKRGITTTGKMAGVGPVTPHIFRHSAAVHMAEKGVPMAEIAQFLGHSDSRITEKVYARFSPTYLKNAANALDYSP